MHEIDIGACECSDIGECCDIYERPEICEHPGIHERLEAYEYSHVFERLGISEYSEICEHPLGPHAYSGTLKHPGTYERSGRAWVIILVID